MSEKNPPGRRVTLSDVARDAGVSVQTASHVMAGNMKVRLPESTRMRVRESAERVGYVPNRIAQAMRRGRTDLVSVWMPLDHPSYVYLEYLRLLNGLIGSRDKAMLVTGLSTDLALRGEGVLPPLWPTDGVISIDSGKALGRFRENPAYDNVPLAVLGLEQFSNSDSVSWDLLGASRQAVKGLIDKGCRRIAHVTFDWIVRDFPREQRRRGYTEELEAHGLRPEFICVQGDGFADAKRAVDRFLASGGRPDGLFCFRDPIALGALVALEQNGFRVPEDCKLIGVGNTPESAAARVPISTIALPMAEVVAQAVEWLFERMESPSIEPRLVILPMVPIHRESSSG